MFQLVIWMMFLPTCIFRDIDRKTICLNSAGKTMIQHQGRIEAHIQRSHHHQSLTQSIKSINSINQINQSTKLTKSNQPINQKNKQINPCIHSSINHCLSPFFFHMGGIHIPSTFSSVNLQGHLPWAVVGILPTSRGDGEK